MRPARPTPPNASHWHVRRAVRLGSVAGTFAVLGCARATESARTVPAGARTAGLAALGWSPAACAAAPSAPDADADGLPDGCELALARAFAPELVVDRTDCLWTSAAPAPRLAGGYLFAAQPAPAGAPPGTVRLAYLPAYLRDCGWRGPVCRLVAPGCGAHDGDSEFIAVDVAPAPASPTHWQTTGVFLSAHCFGRAGGRCRWFRGRALRAFAWADGAPSGAPRVWVALGKHAHYPSQRACDTGHWGYDTCDRHDAVVRVPVRSAGQNVGSRARPLPGPGGCRAAEPLAAGSAGTADGAEECAWDDGRPFRGWQARGPGATAYGQVLRRAAGL